MLYALLWQILIWFGAIAFIIFAYICLLHFKKMKRLAAYPAQGVYMQQGWDTFLVGNIPMFGIWEKLCNKAQYEEKGAEAITFFLLWFLDQSTESKAPESFDYGKHQVQLFNIGEAYLSISDPDIVQDMFTTKN